MKRFFLVFLTIIFLTAGVLFFVNIPLSTVEVVINDQHVALENPVKIEEDTFFAPAERILGELGFDTQWDSENQTLTAILGNYRIEMPLYANEVNVDEETVIWDYPLKMFDGVLYLPVWPAADAIGAFAQWDEQSRTIVISTPETFDPDEPDDLNGPLLNVAHPPDSPTIYYGNSLFVFGTTQSFSQVHVTVNGEPVDVLDSRTGNFLTMVEIPRGEEFPVKIAATDAKGTTVVERSALYPAPSGSMPREPLAIHSSNLIPRDDQTIKSGDTLRVAFQGSVGAEARFWIGSPENQVNMTELAYSGGPPGEGGIYTALYTVSEEDVPARGLSHPMPVTVSLQRGDDRVTRELMGRVTFFSDPPYKIVEVKEEHRLKNRGWLYIMRDDTFQAYGTTIGGTGHPTNVITYLTEGTRYEVQGISGNYYRVKVNSSDTFLIHQDVVRETDTREAPEPKLSEIGLSETGEMVTIMLETTERFPFLVEDGKKQLRIKLYGIDKDGEILIPELPEFIDQVELDEKPAVSDGAAVLTVSLDQKMAGFECRWVGSGLAIDIYKPPVVDRENPLRGKTIIVDPGHGGEDTGASGPGDVHEKDVVLAMGLHLERLLEAEGANVIMTRTEDVFVNLYDRPAGINEYGADLLISIHANAHAQDAPAVDIHGLMILYNYEHNEELADIMLETMEAETDLPAFRTWRRNIAVLRHPQVPSVLVEAGYMMHPDDNWHILHPGGQKELAESMLKGIKEFFLSFDQ